jgi:hypothetical protein
MPLLAHERLGTVRIVPQPRVRRALFELDYARTLSIEVKDASAALQPGR